ncbi:MAG: methylmalonyl-CoA mutase family protein, partial [Pseudomonadota bacterium]
GGHVEYFKYLVDTLRDNGAGHIRVFGGGGGVIIPEEIRELEAYGVTRIYSPHTGQQLGLQGMIDDMLETCRKADDRPAFVPLEKTALDNRVQLARAITKAEVGSLSDADAAWLSDSASTVPVLGITGTGGAGKSSLTDELIRRFRLDSADSVNIAVLAIDPSRRKTGGALLGDRIRMNAIYSDRVYMRSLATRSAVGEVPAGLKDIIEITRRGGFDLVIVETPGIGQGDAGIVPFVGTSLYVMTPEFGAQSQLEKIDMLDFADLVVINKFDRKGSDDALRDVAKQVQRNRQAFDVAPEAMPVFGSIASRFNDDGVTAAYQKLVSVLRERGLKTYESMLAPAAVRCSSEKTIIVPAKRQRYLAEIAETVREYHARGAEQARVARERQQLKAAKRLLGDSTAASELDALVDERDATLTADNKALLDQWPTLKARYAEATWTTTLRDGSEAVTELTTTSLSGTVVPKVAVPAFEDEGEILKWLLRENVPGSFPYTAGVFPFKRQGEDPARMFAGEGDPARTNRRFKKLSAHSAAKRLSTAFDSVTLYGFDPAVRPDIYGKIGNSGVSVATLDDMKTLFEGFDLCDPSTSVSMTINGPAPTILAMYMNTAIDQQVDRFVEANGRKPDADEHAELTERALTRVRGTVQADILKEDQGQNTCIFSTKFSLRVMGDIQQYFIDHRIRNFYSVSISGYHIAEAGANPI